MPSRFSPIGRNEIRRNLVGQADYQPPVWISGDANGGFEPTTTPPQLSYWGVVFNQKQINAALSDPGNPLTWVFNNIVDPLIPGEQRFVSLGSGIQMRSQAGEAEDGWRALSNRLSLVQNVADIDRRLSFKDATFNASQATEEFVQASPGLIEAASRVGFDLPALLKETRNRDHFVYTQNRVLAHAKAMQDITEWERTSSGFSVATSRTASAAFNYLLTDPTFAPGMVLPVGAAGRAASAAPRVGAGVWATMTPILGSTVAARTAVGAAWALRAPAAVHAGLAGAIGHRAARAVEWGLYGGVLDTLSQAERIRDSEVFTDAPEFQQEFSWAELGLSVGIASGLGAAFSGKASHPGGNASRTRQAVVSAAGGSNDSPVRHSWSFIAAQGRLDDAAVRSQRSLQRMFGADIDGFAYYMLDDILIPAGLSRLEVAEAIETLEGAIKRFPQTPPVVAHEMLSGIIREASKVRQGRLDIEDALTGAIERSAWAEAQGEASRSLGVAATNRQVLEEAAARMPIILTRMEQDAARRAALVTTSVNPADLPHLRTEAANLRAVAQRRDLTDAEMQDFLSIDARLTAAGDLSVMTGLSQRVGARYQDGTRFHPLRQSDNPMYNAVIGVVNATRRMDEVRLLIPNNQVTAADIKSAKADLKAARTKLIKALDRTEQAQPANSRDRVLQEIQSKPIADRADRMKALDAVAATDDISKSALLEEGTLVARILTGWGLGRWVRNLATNATGQSVTIRSTLGALAKIVSEFDNAKLRVEDLSTNSTRVHRTMTDTRMEVDGWAGELADAYADIVHGDKFANPWLHPIKHMKDRTEFDKAVILHIIGAKTSSDSDAIRLASLWKNRADELAETGRSLGLFDPEADFFPRRWNVSLLQKRLPEFRTAMANHFLQHWQASKEVHLDTLVAMGKAERIIDTDGTALGWKILGSEDILKSLKRTDLAKSNIVESDYLAALVKPNADGLTTMQASANRAIASLLGTDEFETLSGRLIHRGQSIRSEVPRQLGESIWKNAQLREFIDFRFLDIAAEYFGSSGFRILHTARHQERWGIPGLTMEETLQWLESRLDKLQKELGGSPKDRAQWKAGINDLREKLFLMEGRLPSFREHANALGEFLGDTGTAAAGAIYGAGIGQAVLMTEVAQSIVSRVYSPRDIPRRVAQVFKTVVNNRETRRIMLQSLGLSVRTFRLHTLERLTGHSAHSTFQFGLVPKLLAPWMDVFNLITGGSVPHPTSVLGKAGAVPAALRAMAASQMTMGGLDYFTTFSRLLHVQSSLDETARFLPAAEKMANLLEKNRKALNEAADEAYNRTINAGRTVEQAEKASANARLKLWKLMAREAGFSGALGGDAWQVAEKMARYNLLDVSRLTLLREAIEVTGGATTGNIKTMDLNRIASWSAPSPHIQERFDAVIMDLRAMIESTIHKRVSEQNILQTPTSPSARTWLGRIHHAMTGFARSWYDNNILDTAQMPARAAVAMLSVYFFGEMANRIVRDLWRGRDIADIEAEIESDPDNWVSRSITNLPMLGAYTPFARMMGDALTQNERRLSVQTVESAASGAIDSVGNMLLDSVHGVSPLAENSEFEFSTARTAARFIPGYRSWWASLLGAGIEGATGYDVGKAIEGGKGQGRNRRFVKPKVSIPNLPNELTEALNGSVGDSIPDDLSFLLGDDE